MDWLRWENSFSPLFWEGIKDKEQEIEDDTPEVELRVVNEQAAVNGLLGLYQPASTENGEEPEAIFHSSDDMSLSKNTSGTNILPKSGVNLIEDDMVQEEGKRGIGEADISSSQDLLLSDSDNKSITKDQDQDVSEQHSQDGESNDKLEIDLSLELKSNAIKRGSKHVEYQKQGRIELEKKQMSLLKAKQSGGFSYDEKEKEQLFQMENLQQEAKEEKLSCVRRKTTANKKRKKSKETTSKMNNKKKVNFNSNQFIPSTICCY